MSNKELKFNEFIYDFIFANYPKIEYFEIKREAPVNKYTKLKDLRQLLPVNSICNCIKFPKELNTSSLNLLYINEIVTSILYDEISKEKIFGEECSNEDIIIKETKDNFYIIWNCLPIEYYSECSDEKLDKLYKY